MNEEISVLKIDDKWFVYEGQTRKGRLTAYEQKMVESALSEPLERIKQLETKLAELKQLQLDSATSFASIRLKYGDKYVCHFFSRSMLESYSRLSPRDQLACIATEMLESLFKPSK